MTKNYIVDKIYKFTMIMALMGIFITLLGSCNAGTSGDWKRRDKILASMMVVFIGLTVAGAITMICLT